VLLSSARTTKSLAKIRAEALKTKIRNKEIDKTNTLIVVFKTLGLREYIRNKLSSRCCGRAKNKLVFPENN
jgi:hypothetical protein